MVKWSCNGAAAPVQMQVVQQESKYTAIYTLNTAMLLGTAVTTNPCCAHDLRADVLDSIMKLCQASQNCSNYHMCCSVLLAVQAKKTCCKALQPLRNSPA